MAHAETEQGFNESVHQAQIFIQNLHINNGQNCNILSKLDQFAAERRTYVRYILKTCKGVMRRKGSAMAEQNHSSVLVFLNDGKKEGSRRALYFCSWFVQETE